MTWLAIWAAGAALFQLADRDPTGSRLEKAREAALWPFMLLGLAAFGLAMLVGGFIYACRTLIGETA